MLMNIILGYVMSEGSEVYPTKHEKTFSGGMRNNWDF
jgi:hypothetical protein